MTTYNTTEDLSVFNAFKAILDSLYARAQESSDGIYAYTDAELSALQTALNQLEARVTLLDDADITTNLAAIQSFIDGIDANSDGDIDGLAALISDFNALTSRVDALENAQNAAGIEIDSLKTRMTTAEGTLGTLGTASAGHTGDITDLQGRVTTLEGASSPSGIDEAAARTIATEEARASLAAFVAHMSAYSAITTSGTYPITGGSGSGDSAPV